MTIVYRLSQSGATEAELAAFEREIGAPLPNDYRQFLGSANGGAPEPSGFAFTAAERREESGVRFFLTLDEAAQDYQLRRFRIRYFNRVPVNTLPVACDSFGNVVLLDLDPLRHGRICFWDHELESERHTDLGICANSFQDFAESLF
jgi:hypothetical protein